MNGWINYKLEKLPHDLEFENREHIVEARGKINPIGDIVIFIIEENIDKGYSFMQLIGNRKGWISIETYFFNVPTITLAKEMLRLKMEDW